MLLAVTAFLGFFSVAFGAYSEHGLRLHVSEEMFRFLMTAVRYNQVHAVAGLGVALALLARIDAPRALLTAAGWGFVLGTALFSGGIYLAAVLDDRAFTALAPIGGTTLMLSWLGVVACGAVSARNQRRQHRVSDETSPGAGV